jgi:hypothetical protein
LVPKSLKLDKQRQSYGSCDKLGSCDRLGCNQCKENFNKKKFFFFNF